MQEPTVVINGVTMDDAHVMTIRVALGNFRTDLTDSELGGMLGKLGEAYAARIEEIFRAMGIQ